SRTKRQRAVREMSMRPHLKDKRQRAVREMSMRPHLKDKTTESGKENVYETIAQGQNDRER
ncbi:hypothetical protein, partial [Mesobacillus maritimus]|uniref:hypothetical protein n=1 Tax=Mesobacillus maritimus TaxID=1643336 RepID=UPI001C8E9635